MSLFYHTTHLIGSNWTYCRELVNFCMTPCHTCGLAKYGIVCSRICTLMFIRALTLCVTSDRDNIKSAISVLFTSNCCGICKKNTANIIITIGSCLINVNEHTIDCIQHRLNQWDKWTSFINSLTQYSLKYDTSQCYSLKSPTDTLCHLPSIALCRYSFWYINSCDNFLTLLGMNTNLDWRKHAHEFFLYKSEVNHTTTDSVP